jgi:hypothetical protein
MRGKRELHAGYICPVCKEFLPDFFSNTHCKLRHDMTKKEVIKKYGSPKDIYYDRESLKEARKTLKRSDLFW